MTVNYGAATSRRTFGMLKPTFDNIDTERTAI